VSSTDDAAFAPSASPMSIPFRYMRISTIVQIVTVSVLKSMLLYVVQVKSTAQQQQQQQQLFMRTD
jgi:hypothetical protein